VANPLMLITAPVANSASAHNPLTRMAQSRTATTPARN